MRENDFLFECIEISILEKDTSKFNFERYNQLNWKELKRLLDFHAIRPIVADSLKKVGILESPDNKFIFDFTQEQVFNNLRYSFGFSQLIPKFQIAGLKVLPFKGNLFVEKLFDNHQLREVGDLDLLFHPDSIENGLKLLLNEGYKFGIYNQAFGHLSDEDLINEILIAFGKYEVNMEKDQIHLDVHWGLNYGFLPYRIKVELFFKNTENGQFYGKECILPSPETMFWMIMLHHGGKEFWVRLKHLVDLLAFMKKYSTVLDWDDILNKAKEYKMLTVCISGFYLIEKYFAFPLPEKIKLELQGQNYMNISKIEDYWKYAKKWNTLFPRFKYESVLISQQDPGFSKKEYFKNIFLEYSKPNPIEQGRIISFPENYPVLNFVSKLMSYLLKKLF